MAPGTTKVCQHQVVGRSHKVSSHSAPHLDTESGGTLHRQDTQRSPLVSSTRSKLRRSKQTHARNSLLMSDESRSDRGMKPTRTSPARSPVWDSQRSERCVIGKRLCGPSSRGSRV